MWTNQKQQQKSISFMSNLQTYYHFKKNSKKWSSIQEANG